MSDLEIYRDMLTRAGISFTEKKVSTETIIITPKVEDDVNTPVVIAQFGITDELIAIEGGGCNYDCDVCRE